MSANELQTIQGEVTPGHLLQMAVSQGADLEKLSKLMDLQERWEANQARKSFVVAMAAFKAENVQVLKDKHVKYGNTEYDHATLGGVVEAAIPAMSLHGLSHRWTVSQSDKAITVACIVTHVDGHSESVEFTAGPDTSGSKNSIQAIGSAVTYMQRYTLMSALGLASKDIDGVDPDAEPPADAPQPFDIEAWADAIRDCSTSDELTKVSAELSKARVPKAAMDVLGPLGKKKRADLEKAAEAAKGE